MDTMPPLAKNHCAKIEIKSYLIPGRAKKTPARLNKVTAPKPPSPHISMLSWSLVKPKFT